MIETLEIIIAPNLKHRFENEIEQVIKDVMDSTSGYTMKIYSKVNLSSDYLIIIKSSDKQTVNKGSELGFQIKTILSAFGLVNYSVWNVV
ncbi:MAG: hypothetical protein C0597_15015 [Marinilabiliales bacterium]|nr:MAG: hypothetical protein C0597_15015 [Marinilabiliales bacterium]